MALHFRDAPKFLEETLAVTAGAGGAGLLAVLAMPPAGAAGAGAAALLGGSIAAAVTRSKPENKLARTAIGVAAGGLAAFGFLALANAFGLGALGLLVGGALGGVALGGLLGAEERTPRSSHLAGLASAGAMGIVGSAALANIHSFAIAEGAPNSVATVAMASLLGLWVTAAAGVRRIEKVKDPFDALRDEVMEFLAEPVHMKVKDALEAHAEILEGLNKDSQMAPDTADEARKQAKKLAFSVLETAKTWKQIHADLASPRLTGLEDKLKDLERRIGETTDGVTQGHLQRAAQALAAQKAAVDGLKVGCQRAEAAIDAQAALLERLRLAVAQHRVSDRERFAVEVSAVADQASRLSDDLESLSQAIAEAEALSDRKVLAELERSGRRALTQLDTLDSKGSETRVDESAVTQEHEHVVRH
jgi:hypothetical protein